eukprot:gene47618-58332_t
MNKERDTVELRLTKKVEKLNTKLQDSYKEMEEKEKRLKQQFDMELKKQLDELTRNFSGSDSEVEEEDTFGEFRADSSLLPSSQIALEENKGEESSNAGDSAASSSPIPASLTRQSSASSRRHSSMGGGHRRKASSKGGEGGGMLTETMKLQYRQEIEDEIRSNLQKEMLEKEKTYQKLGEEEAKSDDQGERLKTLLLQIDPKNEDVKNLDTTNLEGTVQLGGLDYIGEVRNENFDRLKGRIFGNDEIISLTMMEYHMRYNTEG